MACKGIELWGRSVSPCVDRARFQTRGLWWVDRLRAEVGPVSRLLPRTLANFPHPVTVKYTGSSEGVVMQLQLQLWDGCRVGAVANPQPIDCTLRLQLIREFPKIRATYYGSPQNGILQSELYGSHTLEVLFEASRWRRRQEDLGLSISMASSQPSSGL